MIEEVLSFYANVSKKVYPFIIVLDRWILCCDCRGESKLEDSGEIHRKTR